MKRKQAQLEWEMKCLVPELLSFIRIQEFRPCFVVAFDCIIPCKSCVFAPFLKSSVFADFSSQMASEKYNDRIL